MEVEVYLWTSETITNESITATRRIDLPFAPFKGLELTFGPDDGAYRVLVRGGTTDLSWDTVYDLFTAHVGDFHYRGEGKDADHEKVPWGSYHKRWDKERDAYILLECTGDEECPGGGADCDGGDFLYDAAAVARVLRDDGWEVEVKPALFTYIVQQADAPP